MTGTGERLLELLAVLQTRQRWAGDELAQRLGISQRTLRRDIDRLRQLGYPVQAEPGLHGGYQLGSGGRFPPLLIGGEEAVAIAVGLQQAAAQPIAGLADAAVRALVKIVGVLPADARHEVESMMSGIRVQNSPANVELETLTLLARASRDSERVRFQYRSAEGVETERYVEPHHVVPIDRRWFLLAWDLDRDDWRTFRLDRAADVHVTKRRFEPHPLPGADPAGFVASRLSSSPSTYHVDVVVTAPKQAVEQELGPWGIVTEEGPDTARLLMDVDDLSWVVLMLAAINADIEAVEPPELLDLLHGLGARFAAAGTVAHIDR